MSNFTLPTTQTLPSITSDWGSQEIVTTTWLTYWQTYFLTFFTASNRLAGGTGFDSDNVADKAITGKHISKNFYLATNPSSDINFGATPVQVFLKLINIPIINADVEIKSEITVETPLAGDNLFVLFVNRSLDGSTWTNIWQEIDTLYIASSGYNFRYKKLSVDMVDIPPTAGIWYYQITVQHARNNAGVPTGAPSTTTNLPNNQRSKLTLEWSNQRQ